MFLRDREVRCFETIAHLHDNGLEYKGNESKVCGQVSDMSRSASPVFYSADSRRTFASLV